MAVSVSVLVSVVLSVAVVALKSLRFLCGPLLEQAVSPASSSLVVVEI
jgi:hypothetical protein